MGKIIQEQRKRVRDECYTFAKQLVGAEIVGKIIQEQRVRVGCNGFA
jgi:hypothetical protein